VRLAERSGTGGAEVSGRVDFALLVETVEASRSRPLRTRLLLLSQSFFIVDTL
jgi:hypothetical protein